MNSELLYILQCIRQDRIIANTFCDSLVNNWDGDETNCIDIACNNCPVRNKLVCSGEHYTTQMSLTMEAVNHETRNPTPD